MKNKDKTKDTELFKSVLRKRFLELNQKKPYIQPILEYSDINQLIEKFNIENNKKNEENEDHLNINSENKKSNIEKFSKIPPSDMSLFGEWKMAHPKLIFERNWDIWKQFHITINSELVIFVIDGRNPEFFYEQDIEKFSKNILVLVNKADLLTPEQFEKCQSMFKNVIFYSTKKKMSNKLVFDTTQILDFIKSTEKTKIGIIGYPNVGKSSVINTLTKNKKAKISSTPGKTKFSQIWHITEDIVLIDCPGLVFPRHEKEELLLKNILNIDQSKILEFSENTIKKIGIVQILDYFNLFRSFKNDSRFSLIENFFSHFKNIKNWDKCNVVKKIIKLRFEGIFEDLGNNEIPKDFTWCDVEEKTTESKKSIKNFNKKLARANKKNSAKRSSSTVYRISD